MGHRLDLQHNGPRYAIVDPVPVDFPSTALTISLSVRTSQRTGYPALLSYAVAGGHSDANELLLGRPANLAVWIAGTEHATGIDIADGTTHDLVVTWSSQDGQATLYVDGVNRDSWVVARGVTLRGAGCLIVGQDQDQRGAWFEEGNAFRGSIGNVTIWPEARPVSLDRASADAFRAPTHFERVPPVGAYPEVSDFPTLAFTLSMRVRFADRRFGEVPVLFAYTTDSGDRIRRLDDRQISAAELMVCAAPQEEIWIYFSGEAFETGVTAPDEGEVSHLVLTRAPEDGLLRLYLDGVLRWTSTFDRPFGPDIDPDVALREGGRVALGQIHDEHIRLNSSRGRHENEDFSPSVIDQVTLWRRAITPSPERPLCSPSLEHDRTLVFHGGRTFGAAIELPEREIAISMRVQRGAEWGSDTLLWVGGGDDDEQIRGSAGTILGLGFDAHNRLWVVAGDQRDPSLHLTWRQLEPPRDPLPFLDPVQPDDGMQPVDLMLILSASTVRLYANGELAWTGHEQGPSWRCPDPPYTLRLGRGPRLPERYDSEEAMAEFGDDSNHVFRGALSQITVWREPVLVSPMFPLGTPTAQPHISPRTARLQGLTWRPAARLALRRGVGEAAPRATSTAAPFDSSAFGDPDDAKTRAWWAARYAPEHTAFTLSFWLKLPAGVEAARLVSLEVPAWDPELAIDVTPDQLKVFLKGQWVFHVPRPSADRWHFVVFSVRGRIPRMYIDGVWNGTSLVFPTGGGLSDGARLTLAAGDGASEVGLRQFAVWSGALPQDAPQVRAETLRRMVLDGTEEGLLFLASSDTMALSGTSWLDEGWLTFTDPPRAHAVVDPVPPGCPTTALSVTFWLRTAQRGSQGTIASYRTGAVDALVVFVPDALTILIGNLRVETDIDVADDAWHFVAVTWSSASGGLNVYVDGTPRWTGALRQGHALAGGGSFVIGQEQDARGGGFDQLQALRGEVSQLALWSSALAAERVREVMLGGVTDGAPGLYLRASSETLAAHGATWSPTTALSLGGGGDRVVLPDFDGMPPDRWTVSLWLRTARRGVYDGGVSYAVPGTDNELLIWRFDRLEVFVAGTRYSAGLDLADGQWHFLAVAYADGRLTAYVDGDRAWSQDIGLRQLRGGGTLVLGQDQDSVGGGFNSAQAFEGQLDEVTIWRRALTAADVAALNRRPQGIDEPGRALLVSQEGVQTVGARWREADLHPALQREARLDLMRRRLDLVGVHLLEDSLSTWPRLSGTVSLEPDYDGFARLGLRPTASTWSSTIECDDLMDLANTLVVRCPERAGLHELFAAIMGERFAASAANNPWPLLCGQAVARPSAPFSITVASPGGPPAEDRQDVTIAGDAAVFGFGEGSFTARFRRTWGEVHFVGFTANGLIGGGQGFSVVTRAQVGPPVDTLEADCTLFGGLLKVDHFPLSVGSPGQARAPTGTVPLGAQPTWRLQGPFRPGRGALTLSFGRSLDAQWALPGQQGGTTIRVLQRLSAGRSEPGAIVAWAEGLYDGAPLESLPRVVAQATLANSASFDALLADIEGDLETMIDLRRRIDETQQALALSGSLDVVDLVRRIIGDGGPEGLDAFEGLIAVTDIETRGAGEGDGIRASGNARVLGIPVGTIEIDFSQAGDDWVFERFTARTGLSFADTGGVLDLDVTLEAWLDPFQGVAKQVTIGVGLFDGLLRIPDISLDLELPLTLPDLLDIDGLYIPPIFAALGGSLTLTLGREPSRVTVVWNPRVTADFWVGELSAAATLTATVPLSSSGAASVKGKFKLSVFGQTLPTPEVGVSVRDLTSVSGISRVFFDAAEALIREFDPADFAIRLVLEVGKMFWEAAGAVVAAVSDALGLSGEAEGSKVGFMEFVRTAVMWHGRYYFFHGTKDTVWRINDRDVDAEYPKSASGTWTHMPVVSESNRLRNVIKVVATGDGGQPKTFLVFDFPDKAIGRCYTIGDPVDGVIPVEWHGQSDLPGNIHTSIYWRTRGTFVFHGDSLVSQVTARYVGGKLLLTKGPPMKVTRRNGWWDPEVFTPVPACAVEGDADGGWEDTDVLYFFDFAHDAFVRFRFTDASPNALTLDAGYPRKITTGWL